MSRADNRARFPEFAAAFDALGLSGIPGVKVLHIEENGQSIGKKPNDNDLPNTCVMSADAVIGLHNIGRKPKL